MATLGYSYSLTGNQTRGMQLGDVYRVNAGKKWKCMKFGSVPHARYIKITDISRYAADLIDYEILDENFCHINACDCFTKSDLLDMELVDSNLPHLQLTATTSSGIAGTVTAISSFVPVYALPNPMIQDNKIPKDLSIMERLTASEDDKVLIKAGYISQGDLTPKAIQLIAMLNYKALKAQLVEVAKEELADAKNK